MTSWKEQRINVVCEGMFNRKYVKKKKQEQKKEKKKKKKKRRRRKRKSLFVIQFSYFFVLFNLIMLVFREAH